MATASRDAWAGDISATAKPISVSAKPLTTTATAVPALPKVEKREVLLFSASLNDKLFLTRMLPNGHNRQFLSQNGGFQCALPKKNRGDDFAAASSPDGKVLAFYSSRSGAVNLWISDSEGRNQRKLTQSGVSLTQFSPLHDSPVQFSPVSPTVAYLNGGNLWLVPNSGDNPIALTLDGGVEAYAWSPDGKMLAYLRKGSVRMVSPNGTSDELLVAGAYNWPSVAFNPDPKKKEVYTFYNGIWRVDVKSKKKERLIGSFHFPNRLRMHPKGELLAFLNFSADVRGEVYTVKKDGKTLVSTQVTLGGAELPFFSVDGNTIFFTRNNGLWRCSLSGEKSTLLYAAPSFMAASGQLEYLIPVDCP